MKKISYLALGLLVSSATFAASTNLYTGGTGLFNSANLCFEIYTPGNPLQYHTLGPDTGPTPILYQLEPTLLQGCPQGNCTVEVGYSIPNDEGLCPNLPTKFGKLTWHGVDPTHGTYTSFSITPASVTVNNITVKLIPFDMPQLPNVETLQFWLSQ